MAMKVVRKEGDYMGQQTATTGETQREKEKASGFKATEQKCGVRSHNIMAQRQKPYLH